MEPLKEKGIYAIDGGFFEAQYSEENEQLALWTYLGLSGHVIARTGFEIDADGRLYHRVFDFETQEFVLFDTGQTIDDLEEVDKDMFQDGP